MSLAGDVIADWLFDQHRAGYERGHRAGLKSGREALLSHDECQRRIAESYLRGKNHGEWLMRQELRGQGFVRGSEATH